MGIALCEKELRMAKSQDTVLTIDELANYLKLSKSTLYHFARNGNVPGVKVGRHWRFHKAAIDMRYCIPFKPVTVNHFPLVNPPGPFPS